MGLKQWGHSTDFLLVDNQDGGTGFVRVYTSGGVWVVCCA